MRRRKMKKFFTIFFILFFMAGLSFSQVYVKLGGGYNLSFNSVDIGTNTTGSGEGDYSYEAVNGSYGMGPNIAGAFGYNFSSYLAGELGVIYKLSTEFEVKDQYGTQTSTTTYNGSFLGFAPTFVINAPLDNIKPFMKIGLLIALPASEIKYSDSEGNTGKGTFGGGVDFGLTGGAGILVPLSTKINFFAEFDFISFTWKPTEVEVTNSDGTTHTYKLEDEWTSNDEYTEGPMFLPFSNVGLNVGIQIGI
jgi:hypothetical protein